MNCEYYFDETADNEALLDVNNIDPTRKFAGDPFECVALIEEELGCPLALA
jgi:hypothetical protein